MNTLRQMPAGLRRAGPGLLLIVSLAGCALVPPALDAKSLFDDSLFQHPARPAEADKAMALDASMRAYLHSALLNRHLPQGKARALFDALYGVPAPTAESRLSLRLDYAAGGTRNAAQAFAARSGNCLSLVLMTAAFAREMGLVISYQSAQLDDAFSRDGELTLRSGHVNLVLGPRPPAGDWRSIGIGPDPDRLQIDFLPPDELRGLRTVPVSEATVLAMYMNNRAAETLARAAGAGAAQAGAPAADSGIAQAYAWVRESLRHDPGFGPALNTLGVVYQRAGHLSAAASVYEQLLAREPRSVAAMWNLAQVREAQGQPLVAAQLNARRRQLEPVPPFHYLALGEAALARGDLGQAGALFEREQRLTGESHSLHFQRARLSFMQGDRAAAQRELQLALHTSPGGEVQQRYAGKLAWLREQGRL